MTELTKITEHERLIITKYDLLFESRLTRVEEAVKSIDQNMKDMKQNIDQTMKDIKQEINKLDARMWAIMVMIIVSMLSPFLNIIAKHYHWF